MPQKRGVPARRQSAAARPGILYEWLLGAAGQKTDHAVVYRDTYLSWRGLLHRVDRRAAELSAMGIGAGDWVGLMLGNVPDLLILSLAASRLRATVVPLDPTTGSRDLFPILSAAPLRALITRPRGGESAPTTGLSDRAPSPPGGVAPEARRRLQGTLLSCAVYPRRISAGPPVEAVLFTSGSAGEPNGVARSEAVLLAVTDLARREMSVGSRDRILTAVPMYSGYGFDFGFVLALRFGTTLVLEDEFSKKRMMKALREHGVTFCPGIPAMYEALLPINDSKRLSTRRARFLSGGSPLSPGLAERFHARFGVRLLSCYHTTEAGPISLDLRGLNPDSVGKPFANVAVRADGNGRGTGPLWVKSPTVSPLLVGARRAPGRVAVGGVDPQGWLRTGDIGQIDRLGRVRLAGREDDLVKVEGRRVALGEVQACIESFPKVTAAKAELFRDPLAGSVVVARVVAAGDCAPEEIIDHCARNLASYKVPRRVRFVQSLLV